MELSEKMLPYKHWQVINQHLVFDRPGPGSVPFQSLCVKKRLEPIGRSKEKRSFDSCIVVAVRSVYSIGL
jgi:hypothetical protein